METNQPTAKKKIFVPAIIAFVAAGYSHIMLVQYGPRRRDLFDSILRPRKPFELLDFDGLTDSGKTLAIAGPIVIFALTFFLIYRYVNRDKLKKGEDIE